MILNKDTERVLNYICQNPYTSCAAISCISIRGINIDNIDSIIRRLIAEKMVSCRSASCKEEKDQSEIEYNGFSGYLVALPDGEAYVESESKSRVRHWIPVITSNTIAIIAIIISIIALLKP